VLAQGCWSPAISARDRRGRHTPRRRPPLRLRGPVATCGPGAGPPRGFRVFGALRERRAHCAVGQTHCGVVSRNAPWLRAMRREPNTLRRGFAQCAVASRNAPSAEHNAPWLRTMRREPNTLWRGFAQCAVASRNAPRDESMAPVLGATPASPADSVPSPTPAGGGASSKTRCPAHRSREYAPPGLGRVKSNSQEVPSLSPGSCRARWR
jgi:hypothetical protein